MSVAATARRSRLVYLLHFERPYHHARHYVGSTDDLVRPLEEHRAGSGSRLLAAVAAEGIGFDVAWLWRRTSRAFERRVHRFKNTPRLCPICRDSDRPARRYARRRATGGKAR